MWAVFARTLVRDWVTCDADLVISSVRDHEILVVSTVAIKSGGQDCHAQMIRFDTS